MIPIRMERILLVLGCFALSSLAFRGAVAQKKAVNIHVGPVGLECESLINPLGLDTAKPGLSWRLDDRTQGAKQTAYEIEVFNRSPTASAKANMWDSGRVESAKSLNVTYEGAALSAEKRYFWRVRVWDKNGKAYPWSDLSTFETGLMSQANWQAKWIGYESPEQQSVRNSNAEWITNVGSSEKFAADTHHDFRFPFALEKPVKRAVLYATGKDTAAAWVNGTQIMQAIAMPAWKQSPWGSYLSQDVTSAVKPGANLLAIEVTSYVISRDLVPVQTPMSACLYVEFVDGTQEVLTSSANGWKSELNAKGEWFKADFIDTSWHSAQVYKSGSGGPDGIATTIPWPTGPVASVRHRFRETSPITSARLYATALGAYKFHINGKVVGDQVLSPGWMDFREHVPYQVYDVTQFLKPGENAIAAYLAPGWYSTPLMWLRQGNNYGTTQPALKAQLRIEHSNGSVEWIATDETWKGATSAILQAEIYDGETMDARKVVQGWDTVALDDHSWSAVQVVAAKEPKIIAQYFQPITVHQTLTAKSISNPAPGVYVLDFGQNMSAQPKLTVRGDRGDDIRLRFAEVLNADGTLYTDNLRTAKATDHYILAGSKDVPEQYQPQFTFHGFRYAEITGMQTKPTLETLKAVVLHTNAPFTARFDTGDKMVNQVWSNVLWGQRSNFIGVPTDCPQRDERLGWSADAQVFWRTAAYDMDLTTFSQKYAADLHGTQVGTSMYGIFAPGVNTSNPSWGAAWSDAGVIVPWTGWVQSGNTRIIDENWDGMEAYLTQILSDNPTHLWQKNFGTPFGDWLTPTTATPEDLLATAYWAYDTTLMKQMAVATGRTADAQRYADLFEKIKEAFQKAYVRSDGFVGAVDKYPSIPPPTIHPSAGDVLKDRSIETQTGYVLALYMKLLPDAQRAPAATKLVEMIKANHWLLGTGFLGTPYLLEVLSDTGHADVAYRLLLNRDYPSWGYLVEHGATTTWERWNGDQMRDDPSMNSYNHYAYGAVAEWMYRYAAGVDTSLTHAGFSEINLHPNFDARLGHLTFDYDSRYGTIHSDWKVVGSKVMWHLTVPPNTTAHFVPSATNASEYSLDGVAISGDISLAAGSYVFTATMKPVDSMLAAQR